MNTRFKASMAAATRLTRDGRLTEALALIRQSLVGSQPQSTSGPSARTQHAEPREEGFAGLVQDFRTWTTPGAQPQAPSRPSGEAKAPTPGGRFEERSFSNAAGRRDYKLYVPAGNDAAPLPLVVMLHGCTQSPDDFAAGTRMNDLAEELRFIVAYPAQTKTANASKCWNWFRASDQRRDQGEPALIAGITRQIAEDCAVDRKRVYVAGLSAGGAAAAVMGAMYPDIYAAVGVHSGLACGAARDIPSAFSAMKNGGSPSDKPANAVPTIVFHGDRDTTVHPVNGEQVVAQAKKPDTVSGDVQRGQSQGGVAYTRAVHRDDRGDVAIEHWTLHGVGHAWSGGSPAGTYTDPRGPDASREMMRFFLRHQVGQG